MKILYGVQATGNGHIARSRTLAKALQKYPELEIQWLFSGRPKENLFGMEIFGDYWWRRGLTFIHREGKLKTFETIQKLGFFQFKKEVSELPIDEFDLIISDYEPVTAWAAKIRKKASVGIGHQYAFLYPIPAPRFNWLAHNILRIFAPTQKAWVYIGIILDTPYFHQLFHHKKDPIRMREAISWYIYLLSIPSRCWRNFQK
ncbi:glycosyltransferase family protein [Microbulbifer sp. MLAF003]|uniref:glycosyltransferase family protein n=1 Tax=Microbulbifer sp. MLAF003 TaxID=3032582 RepID=UPI0024ACC6DA|nr:glycosyltransferase family protein [Microbulbifer sp. MLAF003]WHI50007.1 glycosyltransferase family protein [Microbulbifer sp. MLAF003]